MELFADLNAEGRTILVVTHEQDVMRSIKRQVVLMDGRIANGNQTGTEQLESTEVRS
jgi:putative ABC transport system ATP-binding protein